MKKLLVERFQKLAGIKTSGLTLREEDSEETAENETVQNLIDYIGSKDTVLKTLDEEAAKQLLSALLEKMSTAVQSAKSKILRDLSSTNETEI